MKNKKECTNCNNHSIKEYYGDGHCPECGRKVPPNPFMKNKKEKKHEHNFIWNNRKHPKCKCGYNQSLEPIKKVRIELTHHKWCDKKGNPCKCWKWQMKMLEKLYKPITSLSKEE